MAKIRATSYTFSAAAKTVTSASFSTLESIQLIVNVTSQVIIYNFADAAKGGTLAGTVLTLEYNTAAMADADKLMILIEDGANQSVNLAQLVGAVPSVTNPLPVRDGDGTGFYGSDVIAGIRYRKVSMVQDIELSTTNSSVANIASAASFTGTSQTSLGVAAVQVVLFADQNCTIQVQQAQEDPGTNWNVIDSWTYTANATGHESARTIQAVASSIRVVVTNNGAGTTTVFRLQTIVCPVADVLPRGLSQLGNLRTAIVEVPAITKGTQGATGVAVQNLKDAGRSQRQIFLDSFAVAATAETLMTMSTSADNAAVTTGTSYNVTAAKRLRIQQITVSLHTIAGNTTAVNVIIRIRVNAVGAGIVSSPIQMVIPVQGVAAANQAGVGHNITIPDGWEFVASSGIAVTVQCSGFVATTAAPKVDISITGYEY